MASLQLNYGYVKVLYKNDRLETLMLIFNNPPFRNLFRNNVKVLIKFKKIEKNVKLNGFQENYKKFAYYILSGNFFYKNIFFEIFNL